MSKKIEALAKQCWSHYIDGTLIDGHLHFDYKKFAEMIIEECTGCCGSQADKKNILKNFGFPVPGDIKYPGEEPRGHETQYTRDLNMPGEQS